MIPGGILKILASDPRAGPSREAIREKLPAAVARLRESMKPSERGLP